MNIEQQITGVSRHNQRGIALVPSLIFLLAMTILGITALHTSSLEEGMARNMQSMVQAFIHAETGLTRATQNVSAYNTSDNHSNNSTTITLNKGDATYSRRYLGDASPPRLVNSATGSHSTYHHFEIRSRGTSFMQARSIVNQGGYIQAPNPPGVLHQGS